MDNFAAQCGYCTPGMLMAAKALLCKERIGQLIAFEGGQTAHVDEFGPGDIGAVAKLKESRAGDWLASRDEPINMPSVKLPAPVMAFAVEPKTKGDEEKSSRPCGGSRRRIRRSTCTGTLRPVRRSWRGSPRSTSR